MKHIEEKPPKLKKITTGSNQKRDIKLNARNTDELLKWNKNWENINLDF